MRILDDIYNVFLFRYYHITIGHSFTCRGRMRIQGHGRYTIGSHVTVYSKAAMNPIGGDKTVLQTLSPEASIKIGDHVGISHSILCAREGIEVEDHVLLGGGCKLYDNDFHSLVYQERIGDKKEKVKSGKILIREGAFIGAHAIILKGVTVGKHSIIGAGAVVSKDVPDFEIWAGNPARKIGDVKE